MNILFFLQVAFLTAKRAEDKSKMKEMEKFKVQISQFTDYKAQWSSAQVFFIFWLSDVLQAIPSSWNFYYLIGLILNLIQH